MFPFLSSGLRTGLCGTLYFYHARLLSFSVYLLCPVSIAYVDALACAMVVQYSPSPL